VFHILFAVFFITAFAISHLVDDDSARFALHMIAGLGMLFVVVLRLIWSLVGTRHARLGDLTLRPALLLGYFKGVFSGGGRRWAGHNPASSWAAVGMVALALGLGATGLLMATAGENDAVAEVHELMANALLLIAAVHVSGVVVHMLRYRDHLAASMVTGRKQALGDDAPSVRALPFAGVAFLALTLLFMGELMQSYDAQARTLDLFGTTLQLGEADDGEGSVNSDEAGHAHEDENRTDDD
jgi:cytochrome b